MYDLEHNRLVKAVTEERITYWLAKEKNQSKMILFHHRMPTSTINTRKANHPFTTKNYFGKTEYVLIHNGHISNAEELFNAHQELGIEYFSMLDDLSFTDSEALLWDFALVMEGKQEELKARGGNAMICVKLVDGKPKTLYFGRNSNPLYMTKDNEELHLSSQGLEYKAMREAGKEETMIERDQLYTWHFSNHHLSKKPLEFPQWVKYTKPYKSWDNDEYKYTPEYLRLTKKERKALRRQEREWERNQPANSAYTPGSHAQQQIGFKPAEQVKKT